MKHTRHRLCLKMFLPALVLACVVFFQMVAPGATAAENVSRPGEYSGYSEALYNGDVRTSQYITMRDGTELAVDIYRPTLDGAVVEEPLPVVWMHSPYNRRYYPASGPHLAVDLYPGAARGLIKYGYVVAVVDARGLYASFGSAVGYNRGEWMASAFWDAYDITEWFAAQPWSDGKIGMWGCSATGETQLQAAAANPPHLVAVFPMSCAGDFWGTGSGVGSNAQEGLTAPEFPYWAAYNDIASPVDDDPEGVKRSAARQEQNLGSEIGYVPYRDSVSPWVQEILGLDVRWNMDSSPHTHFDQIERSGVAMYSTANWEDSGGTRWGPIMRYKNLSNPAKMLLGPGGHCIWYTDYSPKPYPVTFRIVTEELRWFDHWLKGVDNGIMDEPPIYLFTYNRETGNEWRFAWQWPLPNEKRIDYYLAAGASDGTASGVNNGTLSTVPPTEESGQDDYVVDYGITTANRNQRGLTYTTAPLTADLEVTGDPVVQLLAASTATDNDFFAYLEDVAPDGSSRYFAVDGSLRASNRALHPPPYDNWGLPYHRSFEKDAQPLEPGKPVSLAFNMGSTSYLFKAGHRIRLIVTCFMPATPPSPGSPGAPSPTPILDPAPTVSIYRNRILKSRLVLPVAGAPVQACLQIKPGIIQPKRNGLLTALVTFPKALEKGYVEDLDAASVRLNGIQPVSAKQDGCKWIFKFNSQDFESLLKAEKVKLTMTGNFGARFDYGSLAFEASNTVLVKR